MRKREWYETTPPWTAYDLFMVGLGLSMFGIMVWKAME